jgi:hypothetical protein
LENVLESEILSIGPQVRKTTTLIETGEGCQRMKEQELPDWQKDIEALLQGNNASGNTRMRLSFYGYPSHISGKITFFLRAAQWPPGKSVLLSQ